MRKIICVLCCLLCLWPISCAFGLGSFSIMDDGLFSENEEAEIETLIEQFENETGMLFFFLANTTDIDSSVEDIEDIYTHSYFGKEKSGVLYWINVYENTSHIFAAGDADVAMDEGTIQAAHAAAKPYIDAGSYHEAAKAVITITHNECIKDLPGNRPESRIVDRASLFSDTDKAGISAAIAAFREATMMDFVILTSNGNHGLTQKEVAESIYDVGRFGIGEKRSGILYYIDMYARVPYLCTSGDMIAFMPDEKILAAHDEVHPLLSSGEYAEAVNAMMGFVLRAVEDGRMEQSLTESQGNLEELLELHSMVAEEIKRLLTFERQIVEKIAQLVAQ